MSSRNLLRAVGLSALLITALIATGCGSDDDERELGYQAPPAIEKLVKDDFGVNVSKERVDLLDVDHLFMLIDPPAQKRLDADDLFNRLGVAREDRTVPLPYYSSTQLGAAIAFSSVLSLPYALDGIAGELDR